MTAIAKATSRIRHAKGSSYLTHGDDTYDKKGMRKARRALDKAILHESLNEVEPTPLPPAGPVTFRLVITTQVYENYGAHCWDGKGECPQHWKAKGGNEYQHAIGTANTVIELGREGLDKLYSQIASKCTRFDYDWDEYVIDWRLVPSNEETFEEKDLREMLEWGMIDKETYEHRLSRLHAGVNAA